jgi:RimJ/RimL family protein N-acetyltransferase
MQNDSSLTRYFPSIKSVDPAHRAREAEVMHVRFHAGAADFAAAAAPVYHRDPVLHTVELSLLRGGPLPGCGAPLLVTVWGSAGLVGAAMATPPFPLLCSGLPAPAIPVVVGELHSSNFGLSGVRGLRTTAMDFARQWQARTGCAHSIDTEEPLYRLGALRPPPGVPGVARPSEPADTELLIDWQCAFAAEAFGDTPDRTLAGAALQSAAARGDAHLLWTVDDEPVSLAGVRRPAVGVSRIGPVFTPASRRGHGYGSAVTAAACRWAGSAGAGEVVLFTDLANPTSNAIYQRIGFEPVADTVHVSFSAA